MELLGLDVVIIGFNLKDGKWILVEFVEEHNHVLATPWKRDFYQAEGFQNIVCTENDNRNFECDISHENEKYDAEMMIVKTG